MERRHIHDSVAFVALLVCVAASPGNGANSFRRARALSAGGGVSGARRRDCDAAISWVGLELIFAFAADLDASAVGGAPLRCAPPAVARLRGHVRSGR